MGKRNPLNMLVGLKLDPKAKDKLMVDIEKLRPKVRVNATAYVNAKNIALDMASIKRELTTQLQKIDLSNEHLRISADFRSKIQEMQRSINSLEPDQILEVSTELKHLQKLFNTMSVDKYARELEKVQRAYDKLGTKSTRNKITQTFEEVKNQFESLQTMSVDGVIEHIDDYVKNIQSLKKEIERLLRNDSLAFKDHAKKKIEFNAVDFINKNPHLRDTEIEKRVNAFIQDLPKYTNAQANQLLASIKAEARTLGRITDEVKSELYSKVYKLEKNNIALSENAEFTERLKKIREGIDTLSAKNITEVKNEIASLSKVLSNLNIDKFVKDLEKLEIKNSKIFDGEAVKSNQEQIQKLQNAIKECNTKSLTNISKEIDGNLNILKNVEQEINDKLQQDKKKSLETATQLLSSQVNNYYNKYTKLHGTKTGNSIQKLVNTLNSENAVDLSAIKSKFKLLQEEAKSLNLEGSKLFEFMGKKAKSFASWFGISTLTYGTIDKLKQMYSVVLEIDSAMTDLKKVTDETDGTYRSFLHNAIDTAEKLKGKISDVISATAEWAKLGYALPDATKLAELNLLYKNVGDVDVSTGTRDMVSVMKAYKLETEDMIGVLDRYNEVSNKFSIDMAGIGEGMRRSSAAMKLAGNDLDDTLGLLVAGNNVLQDPAVVGTFLKTVSMRLRGASGLTKEMKKMVEEENLDMEGTLETMTKTQAKIAQLTNNQVDIMLSPDKFKSTYQMLKDISVVWDDITDKNKAELVEIIGGNEPLFALCA